MKKNRMMRLASILLVCVLLTTSVISGTFAKYTSSATSYDIARVARWNVLLDDTQMGSSEQSFSFDLFETVLDTGRVQEDNVESLKNDTVIAPGTSGAFQFVLNNQSEVDAEYDVHYVVTNENNIPIEFSLDEQNWSADHTKLNKDDVSLPMDSGDQGVTVYWRWVFEGNRDAADTTLGVAGIATVTVQATITVDQVD